MKKIILFLFCLVSLTKISKADTIDFCHAYLNDVEIAAYNYYSFGEVLVIKINSLKKDDVITVKYFRDTPCSDCKSFLHLYTNDSTEVLIKEGKGTFSPISFRASELTEFLRRTNKNTFTVYYNESNKYFPNKLLLFRIRLE